jgi:hypothetical protein
MAKTEEITQLFGGATMHRKTLFKQLYHKKTKTKVDPGVKHV